ASTPTSPSATSRSSPPPSSEADAHERRAQRGANGPSTGMRGPLGLAAHGAAMSDDTLTVDAYQLTTLVAHADAGRTAAPVEMAFFFRKLQRHRNYVLFCGLRSLLEHAAAMRL